MMSLSPSDVAVVAGWVCAGMLGLAWMFDRTQR